MPAPKSQSGYSKPMRSAASKVVFACIETLVWSVSCGGVNSIGVGSRCVSEVQVASPAPASHAVEKPLSQRLVKPTTAPALALAVTSISCLSWSVSGMFATPRGSDGSAKHWLHISIGSWYSSTSTSS